MKALESLGFVTPRDYNSYVKFNIFKGRFYRLKSALAVISVVLLSIVFVLLGFAVVNKSFFIAGGAILLCLLMFFYTISVNVKNHCNSNAKIVRAKQKTVFGKNGFVFELLFDKEENNEHDEIFYDELDAVYDTKNAIYMYIEKRSVIIIPKRNLNMSPAEAREFLVKYIPAQILTVCA